MATTPLRARRYPLESDTPDVAADIHNLALDLENAPTVTQGILSARPSSSVAGNRYMVQGDSTPGNNNIEWYDTGSGWIPVNSQSRGAVNIATSESRTNVAFGTLTTPDQVTGVVLPTNGLIAVWYQATWQSSVALAGAAGIFLGANEVTGIASGTSLGPSGVGTEANTPSGAAGINGSLATTAGGLWQGLQTSNYTGDVTTGQVVSPVTGGGTSTFRAGGPCWIFAAAGTYTVSIQFKATSGSVTASNRKLWVSVLSFS